MHLHHNHQWCGQSNWGGMFTSRYSVIISEESDSYSDYTPAPKDGKELDWKNLIENVYEINPQALKINMRYKLSQKDPTYTDEDARADSIEQCPTLKAEVVQWLEDNINPVRGEQSQGWCMGDVSRRIDGAYVGDFTIWFSRIKDARKFIQTWSTHKKPTTEFNYFKDIRRKLIDGKLVEVEEF